MRKIILNIFLLLSLFLSCSGQKKLVLQETGTLTLTKEHAIFPNYYFFNKEASRVFWLTEDTPPKLFTGRLEKDSVIVLRKDTMPRFGCGVVHILKDFSSRNFLYMALDLKQHQHRVFRPEHNRIEHTNTLPVFYTDTLHIDYVSSSEKAVCFEGDILIGFCSADAAIAVGLDYTPVYFIKLLPDKQIRIIDTIGVPHPAIFEREKYGYEKYFFPFYRLAVGGYNPEENSFIVGHRVGNTFYKISNVKYNEDTTKILSYSMQPFKIHSEYFSPDSVEVFQEYEGKSNENIARYMFGNGNFSRIQYDPEREIYLQTVMLATNYSGLDFAQSNFSIIAFDKHFNKLGEYPFLNNNGKVFPWFQVLPGSRLAFVDGKAYQNGETILRIYKYEIK